MAISTGTRRRTTVGASRRSSWSSVSTSKSDFVSTLPERPSNGAAYLLIFLGVWGFLFAGAFGRNVEGAVGVTAFLVVLSAAFVLGGFSLRKPTDQLLDAQTRWDNRWVCARCGHQWQQ